MKTNAITLRKRFALTTVWLCGLGFSTPVVHAQTRIEQSLQPEPAASLRTIITPSQHTSSIRIRFENQGHGSVHLQMRNDKGVLVHEEWQWKRAYAGDYDLSLLSTGEYTVELTTLSAHHTEIIRIESPEISRVNVVTGQPAATPIFVKNN